MMQNRIFDMISYLLLSVPLKHCTKISRDLRDIEEVKEVAGLYGEMDLLVKIETQDNRQLDRIMLDIIRKYKQIENSRTYVVIGDIYWKKEK
jgi:DNA-binding Lrp family transcriptional regulator